MNGILPIGWAALAMQKTKSNEIYGEIMGRRLFKLKCQQITRNFERPDFPIRAETYHSDLK